jgi:hypothetical protein
MHTDFWSKNLNGRDHAKDLGVDGKMILQWILEEYDGKIWTGFIRIGIAITDRLL